MIRSALMTKAQYLCTRTVQSYDLFWIPLPTYMYIHNGSYAYMYITLTNMIPLLYLCSILISGWFPIFTSLVTIWLIRSQLVLPVDDDFATLFWWESCNLHYIQFIQCFCNHRFQFILWLPFNNWSLCLCLQGALYRKWCDHLVVSYPPHFTRRQSITASCPLTIIKFISIIINLCYIVTLYFPFFTTISW